MNNFNFSPRTFPFKFALVRYEKAVEDLESLNRSQAPLSPERALEILFTRDALQNVLKTQQQVPVNILLQVMQLDLRLKQQAYRITRVLDLPK
ncbi:MAG: hypothetical protein F6K25_30110 [Okeania sp. SIO2G4]|uniref:hypothetical protein n=1 Tax=unclassified Okeania TaxID=2634635 RepID=UPI0013BAE542|nr:MULTISPECIES: hypothetical protein [unclassified Okeania]NEP08257.1 hypothetical protein [Okeania sp. SIO4D6]NEP45772.1 hypothetical protein [Okeania sp. SIO2H7]NEP75686.1 hypothetical protein [Okeania sp. SIO2G5]NEP96808.1 hypothetical protein [Okeania sp. SIO2F5]NEQ94662.1 hypothetical protein [Okeania sp. SIO2G4]